MTRLFVLPFGLLLGSCAALNDIISPPRVPQTGDIQRSVEFRGSLRSFVTSASTDAQALRVTVHADKLTAWKTRFLPFTAEIYEKRLKESYVTKYLGAPSDSFIIYCAWAMDTPVKYSNYNPHKQFTSGDKNRLRLDDGSCTELHQGTMSITLAVFSFHEPFSIQVPPPERMVRLEEALKPPFIPSRRQTDRDIWELKDFLVGESAGFSYEDIPGLIPHSSSERKTGNYYRLVLVGVRTLVSIDAYGPRSSPVDTLQAAVLPVLQSLNFHSL